MAKRPGFVNKIRGRWSHYSYSGMPSFVLCQKLKALKEDLKLWNKQIFRDVGLKRQQLQHELQSLDDKEGTSYLSPEERVLR